MVAPAAVPAVAAAAAAEAAMLLLLAMLAMLLIIQAAPAMGRALEDLMRKIQIVLAKETDEVKEWPSRGSEDLVKGTPKAGMLCSAALILFRQLSNQLIDALTAPRPTDQLGRRRLEKQLVELFEKWQQALGELLAEPNLLMVLFDESPKPKKAAERVGCVE